MEGGRGRSNERSLHFAFFGDPPRPSRPLSHAHSRIGLRSLRRVEQSGRSAHRSSALLNAIQTSQGGRKSLSLLFPNRWIDRSVEPCENRQSNYEKETKMRRKRGTAKRKTDSHGSIASDRCCRRRRRRRRSNRSRRRPSPKLMSILTISGILSVCRPSVRPSARPSNVPTKSVAVAASGKKKTKEREEEQIACGRKRHRIKSVAARRLQ